MVLSASLPSVGPGALKNREDVKILGTPKVRVIIQGFEVFLFIVL
jgi:protein transport protein SEC24